MTSYQILNFLLTSAKNADNYDVMMSPWWQPQKMEVLMLS